MLLRSSQSFSKTRYVFSFTNLLLLSSNVKFSKRSIYQNDNNDKSGSSITLSLEIVKYLTVICTAFGNF